MLTSLLTGVIHVYIVTTLAAASVEVAATNYKDLKSYIVDGVTVLMTEDEYSDAVIDGTIRPELRQLEDENNL